ncbi:hypothetical protein FA95DRAFT_1013812 [Auriscalpium vulgare]|uniref:Uncharacterized protein n=1 Tax=Auriscalpium vulgare TaxID=40419 RepID=A0ACB8R6B2_9AGAM|nr:hypothetical protein FA95DRAFT_1013812 [Auriscalpium vulgare]
MLFTSPRHFSGRVLVLICTHGDAACRLCPVRSRLDSDGRPRRCAHRDNHCPLAAFAAVFTCLTNSKAPVRILCSVRRAVSRLLKSVAHYVPFFFTSDTHVYTYWNATDTDLI